MIPIPIYVALGGALGAVLRYFVNLIVGGTTATLAVNVVGSFVMGCAFIYLMSDKSLGWWMPFILTGILGGFTTFSAFSLEVMRMVQADNLSGAALYVLASVILSVLACGVGIWIMKGLIS